MLVPVQQSKTG